MLETLPLRTFRLSWTLEDILLSETLCPFGSKLKYVQIPSTGTMYTETTYISVCMCTDIHAYIIHMVSIVCVCYIYECYMQSMFICYIYIHTYSLSIYVCLYTSCTDQRETMYCVCIYNMYYTCTTHMHHIYTKHIYERERTLRFKVLLYVYV